ncbi:alpha-hydroxy acid oxidase [Roseovarius sp. C7]|uniref:alpha-hydroxy acid oxidase n=1 Tax=Roseovarius sp. C7 TaxID=3398643 RepID=UPI0039F6C905
MTFDSRYPAIADLKARARRRLPRFVWEYLEAGTGTESTCRRNEDVFADLRLMPSLLHGEQVPDLTTRLLGQDYAMPVGIAPVGMSGLIWPDAEGHLARAARAANLPYTLSTVASQTPEAIGPHLAGNGWFQLYPPRDPDIRHDMLRRARAAGFTTLVLTVDVPVASRRERQLRSGLTQPPRLSPRLMAQVAMRPAWAVGMARRGMPRMALIDDYARPEKGLSSTAHAGYLLRTSPNWDYLAWLRDAWDGPLVVKGVLDPDTVPRLVAAGVDALWLSNHGGRQFDAAPSPLEVLPAIRHATDLPLIVDSGISGGLDILRAMALGADFTMLGRAWHFALAALGADGPAHLARILRLDLEANMGQMGLISPSEAPERQMKIT